jgi:hypothetical protein
MTMKKSFVVALIVAGLSLSYVSADRLYEADFDWTPTNPDTSDVVHFTDQSTPALGIVRWIWYFGDGNGSTVQNPNHRYAHPGTYTVQLVVEWNISETSFYDVTEKDIVIGNQPPQADAGPDQIANTRTVTLNGSASTDTDGTIDTYQWQFGDGTSGNGEIAVHTYPSDGVYTATLNVTDYYGDWDRDTAQVTVDTTPPATEAELNGTLGDNDWYVTDVSVTLNVSETTSGVNVTYYRIDGGNWTEYNGTFDIETEGEHLLQFYSIDNAGNKEALNNVTVRIDKQAPTLVITTPAENRLYLFGRNILPTIAKTKIIGKITVEVAVTDTIGIDHVSFLVNGEVQAMVTQAPYEWRWGQSIGNKNLTVVVEDTAGQTAQESVDVFIFSILKPREASDNLD